MSIQLKVNANQSNPVDEQLLNSRLLNLNGQVTINLEPGDDQVRVTQLGVMVYITVNRSHGMDQIAVDTLKTQSIAIQGKSGKESILVDPSVIFPLKLRGGSGSNTIIATNPGHNDIFASDGEDQITAKGTDNLYGDYRKVINGEGALGTTSAAEIPPPDPSPEEIQKMWEDVLQNSANQVSYQTGKNEELNEKKKMKELEMILDAVLKSGNIDLAVLLISGLEAHAANGVAKSLMKKMQTLQQERRSISEKIGKLGNSPEDAKQANVLNLQAGGIGTEMNMLQTFLQDVIAQKNEAEQLASNYLKSKHDTAQSILRNMG